MKIFETIFGKNYKITLWSAFLWSLFFVIISFLLSFLGIMVFGILGIVYSTLLANAIYGLFLYLGLKGVSKKIPMEKYEDKFTYCGYILIYVILLSTFITSIVEQKFTLSGSGLLVIALTVIIPLVYNPKSQTSKKID